MANSRLPWPFPEALKPGWISQQLDRPASDKLGVSPTILRTRGFRFYFFSREEPGAHVHAQHAIGQAKFWLEPEVELAQNYGLGQRRVSTAYRLIKEHEDEIRAAWESHFDRRG